MRYLLLVPRLVGSRGVTVILLGVSAIAMAWISFLEARTAPAARTVPFHAYLSPWFTGLLWLVCINLVCNLALRRSWRRWRALPQLAAHVGFLLVLAGGFVTWRLGIRGNLPISEGESRDVFICEAPVLQLHGSDGAVQERFLLNPKDGTFEPQGLAAALNPFRDAFQARTAGGVRITLRARRPSSRTAHELEPDPTGRGVAGVVLEYDSPPQEVHLQSGATHAHTERLPVRLSYLHTRGGDDIRRHVERVFGETIELAPPQGPPVVFEVALPEDAGKELAGGGYRVTVLTYYPNFRMGREPSPDDPPDNPAVRLEVAGPSGTRELYAFAFLEFHGSRLEDGTEVRYRRPRAGSRILVLSRSDGALEAYTGLRESPVPLVLDQPADLGVPPHARPLRVTSFLPSSRRVARVIPAASGEGAPAFLVALGEDAPPAWLTTNAGVARDAAGALTVSLVDVYPLGFELTLDEAVSEQWPASQIPKVFYSQVRLRDGANAPVEARVQTNAPLAHGDFVLFQSSMDSKPPYRWSGLAVSYDPGVPLAAAGFYLLHGGLLWLYTVRFILRPLRKRRGERTLPA